jgi:DNA mismatch endonuclease (patch repair protein)
MRRVPHPSAALSRMGGKALILAGDQSGKTPISPWSPPRSRVPEPLSGSCSLLTARALLIILMRLRMKTAVTKTSPERSANMARIRSKDTKPEMLVRRALHGLGFRFRLHVRGLPGHPDIVLPKFKTVIQVKGCFWHGHTCRDGRLPKSNRDYWVPKLTQNRKRDCSNDRKLRDLGWSVRNLWECRICSLGQDELGTILTRMFQKNSNSSGKGK